jgi:anoctamin-10
VALWSVIWPITPLCAVLNNWLELRSDAVKLCLSHRRPVPQRGDSIGPWLNNIKFLSWLGTLTTSTLIYLFQGGDFNLKCDKTMVISLLVTVLVAEHGYYILDRALAALSQRVQTVGEINVRKEEYSVRRRYLQNIGLGSGQDLSGDQAEVRREKAASEDVVGFWGGKGVDSTVTEARELLSRSWEKRKVQ